MGGSSLSENWVEWGLTISADRSRPYTISILFNKQTLSTPLDTPNANAWMARKFLILLQQELF